jgi:hypothetical protein
LSFWCLIFFNSLCTLDIHPLQAEYLIGISRKQIMLLHIIIKVLAYCGIKKISSKEKNALLTEGHRNQIFRKPQGTMAL